MVVGYGIMAFNQKFENSKFLEILVSFFKILHVKKTLEQSSKKIVIDSSNENVENSQKN